MGFLYKIVIIRNATLKDCEACFELSKIPELLMAVKEPLPLDYFRDIVQEGSIFVVAENNGEIVGYSAADILPGKVAIWWLLSVNPSYQNQGIGKKLVKKIEEECARRRIKYIVGLAPKSNSRTLDFHRKNGYVIGQDMVEVSKILY